MYRCTQYIIMSLNMPNFVVHTTQSLGNRFGGHEAKQGDKKSFFL